jgi:hypothetical protein
MLLVPGKCYSLFSLVIKCVYIYIACELQGSVKYLTSLIILFVCGDSLLVTTRERLPQGYRSARVLQWQRMRASLCYELISSAERNRREREAYGAREKHTVY